MFSYLLGGRKGGGRMIDLNIFVTFLPENVFIISGSPCNRKAFRRKHLSEFLKLEEIFQTIKLGGDTLHKCDVEIMQEREDTYFQ